MDEPIHWLRILVIIWSIGGLIGGSVGDIFCKWQEYDIRWKRYLVVILCCGPIVWAFMTVIAIISGAIFVIDRSKKWMNGGDFLTTDHLIIWLDFRKLIGFPYKNEEVEDE